MQALEHSAAAAPGRHRHPLWASKRAGPAACAHTDPPL